MVSLVVRYLHLAALMVGGGTALAIDRLVLGSARARTDDRRQAALNALHGSHAVVVPALIVVTASGILMAAADWADVRRRRSCSGSRWGRSSCCSRTARRWSRRSARSRRAADTRMWRRVILASGTSFLLWLFILWMGEWLTVAA